MWWSVDQQNAQTHTQQGGMTWEVLKCLIGKLNQSYPPSRWCCHVPSRSRSTEECAGCGLCWHSWCHWCSSSPRTWADQKCSNIHEDGVWSCVRRQSQIQPQCIHTCEWKPGKTLHSSLSGVDKREVEITFKQVLSEKLDYIITETHHTFGFGSGRIRKLQEVIFPDSVSLSLQKLGFRLSADCKSCTHTPALRYNHQKW